MQLEHILVQLFHILGFGFCVFQNVGVVYFLE